jgi:hypothetical protein
VLFLLQITKPSLLLFIFDNKIIPFMKCKLCGLDKKLVKAHIIPNFMYSGLFSKTHDIISANLSNPKSKKKIQTGYFDKNILCESCDNEIIGSYERHAHRVLFDEQYTNEDNLKSKMTVAETE